MGVIMIPLNRERWFRGHGTTSSDRGSAMLERPDVNAVYRANDEIDPGRSDQERIEQIAWDEVPEEAEIHESLALVAQEEEER
jgi:hypothetical protein